MRQRGFQQAYEHLMRSNEISLQRGLDGICFVSLDFGQLLVCWPQRDLGKKIRARSGDGFLQLGRKDLASDSQRLLDECSKPSS